MVRRPVVMLSSSSCVTMSPRLLQKKFTWFSRPQAKDRCPSQDTWILWLSQMQQPSHSLHLKWSQFQSLTAASEAVERDILEVEKNFEKTRSEKAKEQEQAKLLRSSPEQDGLLSADHDKGASGVAATTSLDRASTAAGSPVRGSPSGNTEASPKDGMPIASAGEPWGSPDHAPVPTLLVPSDSKTAGADADSIAADICGQMKCMFGSAQRSAQQGGLGLFSGEQEFSKVAFLDELGNEEGRRMREREQYGTSSDVKLVSVPTVASSAPQEEVLEKSPVLVQAEEAPLSQHTEADRTCPRAPGQLKPTVLATRRSQDGVVTQSCANLEAELKRSCEVAVGAHVPGGTTTSCPGASATLGAAEVRGQEGAGETGGGCLAVVRKALFCK